MLTRSSEREGVFGCRVGAPTSEFMVKETNDVCEARHASF